ncbi:IS256-like element IS1249 family transposase [Corynebacterium diphtheriae]|nr:IS256-like element IS1249 family transposase [Corynebacterium diphtheriae]
MTFGPWLKEKTYRSQVKAADIPRWATPSQKFWFTHRGARRSFNRLHELINGGTLFTYLNPPEGVTCDVKSTTNLLEGGINKQLKDLARAHRGTFDEHHRIIMDWWLYIRTENPVPPLQLALEQDFGRKGEQKAREAWAKEEIKRRGHADGRPAAYDTGIDSEWNPLLSLKPKIV